MPYISSQKLRDLENALRVSQLEEDQLKQKLRKTKEEADHVLAGRDRDCNWLLGNFDDLSKILLPEAARNADPDLYSQVADFRVKRNKKQLIDFVIQRTKDLEWTLRHTQNDSRSAYPAGNLTQPSQVQVDEQSRWYEGEQLKLRHSHGVERDAWQNQISALTNTLGDAQTRLVAREMEVNTLREQAGYQQTLFDSERASAKDIHEHELRKLETELNSNHRTARATLISNHQSELAARAAEHASQLSSKDRDYDALKRKTLADGKEIETQHASQITKLREKSQTLQGVKEALERRVSELETHTSELNSAQRKSKQMIEKLTQEITLNKQTITQMTDEHDSKMEVAEATLRRTIAKMTDENKRNTQTAEATLQQTIANLTNENKLNMQGAQSKLEQTIAKLTKERERAVVKLETAYTGKITQLRTEIDAYNTSLISRDEKAASITREEIKTLSDEDIGAKFSEVAKMIDSIARVRWKDLPGITDEDLSAMSPSRSQREMKKQLVQDSLWAILHKHVFGSPFRALGEEGRKLEEEWNAECGNDFELNVGVFKWPKANFQTERWRYLTVKECRTALSTPLPSKWDPRAPLKKSFAAGNAALKSELLDVLTTVADSNNITMKDVERLASKASSMWLDFGSQRCRVLVISQGSRIISVPEKLKQARKGVLNLDMIPKLIRFGDSSGLDLDVSVIVGSRKGEMVKISQ